MLDGEVVVQDEEGRSSLEALYQAMENKQHRLVYFAFDLLHLDGVDLRSRPLIERKAILEQLIGVASPFGAVHSSEHFDGDGAALFRAAEKIGLEGIVSKRTSSPYRSGRSAFWQKTKCMIENEFIVVGMEPNPGGAPFALLAREDAGRLTYAGSAFVTLGQPARDQFWSRAEALKIAKAALPELRGGGRKASFIRPELRVRARHLRGEGMLRHASLTNLV